MGVITGEAAADLIGPAQAPLLDRKERFLLGSRSELAPVWKGYGVQPQTDDLEHSAAVVLVDARGRPHSCRQPDAGAR